MDDPVPGISPAPSNRIARLAWASLWLTVAVVVGGALVRATDSGAGCGDTWPICGGQFIPNIGSHHTAIEISHRLTTGLLALTLVTLYVLVRREFPKEHRLRRAVRVAGALLVVESLLGASLVLFGWVQYDASIARLFVVPIHLANTFMLVGSLTMVAFFASGGRGFRLDLSRRLDRMIIGGLGVLLLIGATGALNALADTLLNSDALRQAAPGEFLVTEPVLRQIRSVHPFLAIAGGLAIYMLVRYLAAGAGRRVRLLAGAVQAIVWLQFVIGMINIALGVPLEIQLVHLLVADILWISFVLIGAHLLAAAAAREPATEPLMPSSEAA
jgi:cytochrome c oxidase assembly protein subunit 15